MEKGENLTEICMVFETAGNRPPRNTWATQVEA